jgi:hypothetical protein
MDGFHSSFPATTTYQMSVHGDLFGAFSEMTADQALVYVFTTGATRSRFYANGAAKSVSHHTVDATLNEIAMQNQRVINLKYLTNAEEAKYGFGTLQQTEFGA